MKDYIELTEEILASLKPNDIIAVTIAEDGAMGDPGAIEIVDKKLNIYHTYSGKINRKILHEKIPFLKDLELFFGNINKLDEKKWSGLYTGFGNYLFVRPKYKQPILEYVYNNYDYDKLSKAELYVHWYEALKEIMGKKNGQ
ncbi:hypothetical protein IJG78_03610 [Candidatus Saccharibacteria bacterium]|nr:hypothetical protein [Candidatus Saccharibacteria bacterium]